MKKQTKTPWGGGIKRLKPQKLAFTLAEVLITLAIIGIVAALTIPTLVSKNEKKQLYTQFMKTYNTLSNAVNMAVAEHGDPKGWITPKDSEDASKIGINKYIMPYLKTTKICDSSNYSDCMPLYSYKALTGDETLFVEGDSEYFSSFAILADGSSLLLAFEVNEYTGAPYGIYFYIDVNGFKGPNVLGRDMHIFAYEKKSGDGAFRFGPAVDYEITDGYGNYYDDYGSSNDNCNPSAIGSDGVGCAARMLKEGAMNY